MLIDNAVPELLFNNLKHRVGDFQNIPFYFLPYSAYDDPAEKSELAYSWSHTLFLNGSAKSELTDIVSSCFFAALSNTDEIPKSIIRMRMGFITAQENPVIHDPHIDYLCEHRTALLYLNDSDGDTYIYNQRYDANDLNKGYDPKTIQVVERVTPKANRIYTFDGLTYHSSSTPTKNSYRAVININYQV